MSEKKIHGYNLASKTQRLFATLVEALIFSCLIVLIYVISGNPPFKFWEDDFKLIEIVYSALSAIVVGAIFYPLLIGNLGHRIFNLKVISVQTGEDYKTSAKGALREFLKSVLSWLFIPAIWILWDEKNQNLYYKITKTVVVERLS